MLKLVGVTSGYETNWHSVLEQVTGLFNGLALAVAVLPLARRSPALVDEPRVRRWTEVYAVGFVLLLVTYLNLRKNPAMYVRDRVMPGELYGVPTAWWFDAAYALIALAVLLPLTRHLRRPLALVPTNPLGRGQWFYLVFLWWIVVGNFERALPGFAPQRLITEGVITANAVIATLLLLLGTTPGVTVRCDAPPAPKLRRLALVWAAASLLAVVADWGVVRAIYGDRFAGHASLHTRFGPNATTGPNDRR